MTIVIFAQWFYDFMKRISVNWLEEALPLTFHESISDLLFLLLLSDFPIPHSNELFLENRERCLVYQLLRKYFSCTTHKIQSLSTYFVFVLSVFTVLDGFITFTLVTSQSYSSHCSSALLQPSFYGEDYSSPFSNTVLISSFSFHSGPLLLFTQVHTSVTVFQFPFITSSVLTRYHS